MADNRLFFIIFFENEDYFDRQLSFVTGSEVLQWNLQAEDCQVGEFSNTINITVTRQIEV
ncbi:MAG: hypothetical protein J7604_09150 [Sporocytophaga sp.]|uniref:hypothetical protein n=1 Tax=Sporocytophaga sp. TaxID=2231183 RepID=UPI001B24E2D4|nr:hypothetical protein [Sporocytophaga sp.]MBO9700361.1 hypothetical protein [Sporocytophaga sp.]